MVHSNINTSVSTSCAPMNRADLLAFGKKFRHRKTAKGYNCLGIESRNLPIEIAIAGYYFIGIGITIVRGAAFYHIGNKDIRAFQIYAGQSLFQQASRTTNKGASLLILVIAGTFT